MFRLRELRNESDKTQSEMAQIFGISRQVYANYENEINQPSCEMLIKIANYFECSIDYLLCRTDDFGNIQGSAPALSPDEKKLLDDYRALNTKNRMHVSAYASIRREEQEEGALKRG